MRIVRGTTPTIRYTFSTVDVSTLTVAKLILEQGSTVVEKDLSSATIGDTYIEWTLSQADTLKLDEKLNCSIKLDWKLQDGTRGIGKTASADVTSSAVNEVL